MNSLEKLLEVTRDFTGELKKVETEERERRQRIVEQNGSSRMHYDNDGDATFGGEIGVRINKYKVECKGEEIDVYDVLVAFKVVNPAIQHALKKLLKAGNRGYKNEAQDYTEAIESINRGIELIK